MPAGARARSATCLVCHAPGDDHRLAQASASALWAGRAGVDPQTGAPLNGPAPHLAIDGGCIGCHREGPDGVEHGTSHGFQADRNRCTSCHDDPARDRAWQDERARIEKQARDLWNDLLALRALAPAKRASPDPAAGPPHATTTPKADARTPLGRATYDLSLLLEDRGFLAHNLARICRQGEEPIERGFHGCAVVSTRSAVRPPTPLGAETVRRRATSVTLVATVVWALATFLTTRAHAEEETNFGRVRYALLVEPAFGVGSGSFYNQLVGARVDYRFTRELALGPYLGYANLKGKDGRTHNVLPYLNLEYRPRFGAGSAFGLPLRFGTGYLPNNGPFLRLSAGVSYALSPQTDIVIDVFTPTFWVVHDRTVISLGAAIELSFAP